MDSRILIKRCIDNYNPSRFPHMRVCDLVRDNWDFGLNDYPIWDESKREWLNELIIDEFYFREIAFDSPSTFISRLNHTMNKTMYWLNVVFESNETLKTHDDLLNNEEINETVESTTHSESEQDNKSYSATTPQQSMLDKDIADYYDVGNFGGQVGKSDGDSTVSSHRKGHYGRTLTGAVREYFESASNTLRILFSQLDVLFIHTIDDVTEVVY